MTTDSIPSAPRILIVEDDSEIRDTLADLLRSEGYDVSTALNGLDALAMLSQFPPNLVLLDLTMPVMDGSQFLATLRDRGQRSIPIVIVSAVAFRAVPGASAIVRKPINFDALLTIVVEHCGKPPSRMPGDIASHAASTIPDR